MKHLQLLLAFFILSSPLAFSQEGPRARYVVAGARDISINGETFVSLELAAKTDKKIIKELDCGEADELVAAPEALKLNLNDLVVAANVAATGLALYEIPRVENDKAKHFLAGYVISNSVTGAAQLLLPKSTKNRKLIAALIGFGASILAGAGKEIYDAQHPESHTADVNDALATVLGGAVGTFTISLGDTKKVVVR